MSFPYTQAVFKAHLPGTEKLILWVLAERANNEGRCFPGQARIAKDAGVSYSTAQRTLDKLISRGVVSIVGQSRYKNTFALGTKTYQLGMTAIKDLAPERLQVVAAESYQGVGGELPTGSVEPIGVVAESLLNQSYEPVTQSAMKNLSASPSASAAPDSPPPTASAPAADERRRTADWQHWKDPQGGET